MTQHSAMYSYKIEPARPMPLDTLTMKFNETLTATLNKHNAANDTDHQVETGTTRWMSKAQVMTVSFRSASELANAECATNFRRNLCVSLAACVQSNLLFSTTVPVGRITTDQAQAMEESFGIKPGEIEPPRQ